jgi:sugar lactone lactonase YvrE
MTKMSVPVLCSLLVVGILSGCSGSGGAADVPSPAADVIDSLERGTPDACDLKPAEIAEEAVPREIIPMDLPEQPLAPQLFTDQLPAATEGIVFDGQGNFYLSSTEPRIFKVNAEANVEVFADLPTVEEGVNPGAAGIALSPTGTLFVCRFDADRIDFVPIGEPDAPGIFIEGIDTPNTLLVEEDGAMWYTSSGGHNDWLGHIGRIPHGGEPEVLLADVTYANGLALSPDRKWLYFSSSQPGSIHRTPIIEDDKLGPPELLSEVEELTVADGLLMGPDGTLFVAGFAAGKILAWRAGLLTPVAATDDLSLLGTATLAWGKGAGFSPTAIYATNLLKPSIFVIELAD